MTFEQFVFFMSSGFFLCISPAGPLVHIPCGMSYATYPWHVLHYLIVCIIEIKAKTKGSIWVTSSTVSVFVCFLEWLSWYLYHDTIGNLGLVNQSGSKSHQSRTSEWPCIMEYFYRLYILYAQIRVPQYTISTA